MCMYLCVGVWVVVVGECGCGRGGGLCRCTHTYIQRHSHLPGADFSACPTIRPQKRALANSRKVGDGRHNLHTRANGLAVLVYQKFPKFSALVYALYKSTCRGL